MDYMIVQSNAIANQEIIPLSLLALHGDWRLGRRLWQHVCYFLPSVQMIHSRKHYQYIFIACCEIKVHTRFPNIQILVCKMYKVFLHMKISHSTMQY